MSSSLSSNSVVRILVVDDNSLGLSARKAVLEGLGYKITAVSSGQEALEQVAKSPVDILITDYKMPRMNGLELIKRVKTKWPQVPVILLSGFVDALALDTESTGADVVIQKSANEVNHMIRAVSRLLAPKSPKRPVGAEKANVKAKRQSA